MELKKLLWETFMYTGNIEAYLLYKNSYKNSHDTEAFIGDENGKEELIWQTSKPRALS